MKFLSVKYHRTREAYNSMVNTLLYKNLTIDHATKVAISPTVESIHFIMIQYYEIVSSNKDFKDYLNLKPNHIKK